MKTIVTHLNPDLDAMSAVWLIRRFLPGWSKARVEFVPAGETFEGKPVDDDLEIIHCDTGGGKFDHHETDKDICAATLIWKEILKENPRLAARQGKLDDWHKKAVERMLTVINEVDHAKFLAWPKPSSDLWDFSFYQALGGVVGCFENEPVKILDSSLVFLDGIFKIFCEKIEAEGIFEYGIKFKTVWGKGIAAKTDNAEFRYLALKSGFAVAVRQRPKTGHLGIYGNWQKGVNLREVYEKLLKLDPKATWFFHASGCLVLNGSVHNPKMKATKLGLEEAIEILKI